MKRLVTPMVLGVSLLISSPAFAYEVKSGDTMWEVATSNDLTLQQLVELNPQVENPNLIYVGQVLNTSVGRSVVVATPSKSYSAYEMDLLARLVNAEAESEPYAGKVEVARVVLNRVENAGFPNTITGVIMQPGQFDPVRSGRINSPAHTDSVKAANEVLSSYKGDANGELFFYNPDTATSDWIRTRPVVTQIGDHVFTK